MTAPDLSLLSDSELRDKRERLKLLEQIGEANLKATRDTLEALDEEAYRRLCEDEEEMIEAQDARWNRRYGHA